MGDEEMTAVGLRSLEWLVSQHVAADGTFAPVGSNGFYVRGAPRASSISSRWRHARWSRPASRRSGDRATRWLEHARRAFHWFLGQNPLQAQVYDARPADAATGSTSIA